MGAVAQVAFGIVAGVATLAVGAAFVARAEGAARAVAVLGCTALGLMLLADLLVAAGLSLPASGSYLPVGLLVGGVSLALLALPLMLMGCLTGFVWAGRHSRPSDLAVLGLALVAQVAAGALAFVSVGGLMPAASVAERNMVFVAIFGLGTLAAALTAFWAVPTVRRSSTLPHARSHEAA